MGKNGLIQKLKIIMKKVYCTNCGEPYMKSKFCGSCGQKTNDVVNDELTDSNTAQETKKQNDSSNSSLKKSINPDRENKKLRSGSTGWIIFGFISAILGGVVGIAMGAHYAWWGKNYDSSTRSSGYIMMLVGVICLVIWKSI